MPVAVDHEERRAEVVAVASQLIARNGIEAVSVRDIAEAAGCSTAIVSHYFHNKRELLLLTYNATIEHATARAQASLEACGGHVKAYLAEIMPLDEERWTEWRIWLQFWAKAASDPEIAAIQQNCVTRTRGNICAILEEEQRLGRIHRTVDCEEQARRLLTSIIGMAVQVMYDAADWTIERQHAFIDAELAALYRTPGKRRAASAVAAE
jgi:AcrR family transcriptional regulator